MTAELLAELVELTPHPPQTTDADELLRAFAEMFDARQRWFDAHPYTGAPTPEESSRSARVREIAREIAARDEAWQRALEVARDAIGQSRHNAGRLRAYHR